jgi:hypothetical protein
MPTREELIRARAIEILKNYPQGMRYSKLANEIKQQLARWLVPKMAKNGFNFVLQTSAGSRRLVATRNSGTNAKSKTVSKS